MGVTKDKASPNNWHVTSNDGSIVSARNSVTGETFSGSTSEFNALIKAPSEVSSNFSEFVVNANGEIEGYYAKDGVKHNIISTLPDIDRLLVSGGSLSRALVTAGITAGSPNGNLYAANEYSEVPLYLFGVHLPLSQYAIGDDATDNGDDIIRWINDLKITGKPGYVPAGTFRTSKGFGFSSTIGVEIHGAGMDRAIIKGVGLAADEDLLSIDCLQNLVLENFRLTLASGGRHLLNFQHTGTSTSVRHKFKRLHLSNATNGAGFVANNLEQSSFEHVYIYGCQDGFLGNNTGNGSGYAASCVSNILLQVRVLFCKGRGMEFQNWAMSTLDHCQVLQCGKTVAADGSGTLTPGHVAQINVMGSCNGFTLIHPDVEEYAVISGAQVLERLTTGIQLSGTNHTVDTPNLFGLGTPGKTVSANDFILIAPRIVSCTNNWNIDAASARVVLIIPRQVSNSGPSTTIIGGGSSGYTNSPAAISVSGTSSTFRPPKLTTTQRDALVGCQAGDEIFNSTLNKKQFYNGGAWETVTSA